MLNEYMLSTEYWFILLLMNILNLMFLRTTDAMFVTQK